MYAIRKSIDIDFSHHIRGHRGACINIHGHTWKFEIGICANTLDAEGFVVDFKVLKSKVLEPCHRLLDHGLAMGKNTYQEVSPQLQEMGKSLLESRQKVHGTHVEEENSPLVVQGARNEYPGGMKVVVFDFNPTSERLASWLYQLAATQLNDDRVHVEYARIYETLHPVESVAEFRAP